MNEKKKNPASKNNNVIEDEVLEQKRKDSTVKFTSVASRFEKLLEAARKERVDKERTDKESDQ